MVALTPQYNLTVSLESAKDIADNLRLIDDDFDDERDRVSYAGKHFEITTIDDYVLVTTIADIVPKTGLTADELYQCEDHDELFSKIFDEYLSSVHLRDVLQSVSVGNSIHRFEIPVSDPDPMSMVSEEDEFTPTSMEYRTETIDMEKQLDNVAVGSEQRSGLSIEDVCQDLASTISYKIEQALDVDMVVVDDTVYDLVFDIKEDQFNPDVAIVGSDVLDSDIENGLYNLEILEDEWIRDNELIIADSDHVGYECVWSEPEIEVTAPLELGGREQQFTPLRVDFKQAKNWLTVEEGAIARTLV